jgi:hypothetical protein
MKSNNLSLLVLGWVINSSIQSLVLVLGVCGYVGMWTFAACGKWQFKKALFKDVRWFDEEVEVCHSVDTMGVTSNICIVLLNALRTKERSGLRSNIADGDDKCHGSLFKLTCIRTPACLANTGLHLT